MSYKYGRSKEMHALVIPSLIEFAVKTLTGIASKMEARDVQRFSLATAERPSWSGRKEGMKRKRNETRERVTWKTASTRLLEHEEYFSFWFPSMLLRFSRRSVRAVPAIQPGNERKQAGFHPIAYFVRRSMKIASGYRYGIRRFLVATFLSPTGYRTESFFLCRRKY